MAGAVIGASIVVPLQTAAAQDPVSEAIAHEDARRFAQAATAYRTLLTRALAGGDDADQIALALLGLERVWHELALRDSIVPVVDEVLLRRPADPVARSIQFRALSTASREAELRAAFVSWRRAAPDDASPWREYVRTLMSMGRTLSADSVLADAARALTGKNELAGEVAQIAATLERWNDAALAWRAALAEMPWMEMAATFSLQRAPETARDSVRNVLAAAPIALLPRRVLAALETGWGDPRRGWAALAEARTDDSSTVAWKEFAERAEAMNSWSVARDVWSALYERSADAAFAERAAEASLAAGDAEGALMYAERAAKGRSPASRATSLLRLEVRALGELGRAEEASSRVVSLDQYLDNAQRAELARPLVGAWLRSGNVERAREVASRAGDLDDDEVIGWLALYDGDLTEARKRLVRATTRDASLTDALAVLARTKVPAHAGLGAAFLALARRDSANAVLRFAGLADSLPDAAPALLATAARVSTALGTTADAVRYWTRIVSQHATAPEVPEALLELARAAVRARDTATATARYETLLIDHPGSAMVPQARRELERLRGRVPEEYQ
jgi:tetratricopeptide (TPR) repeat protein